MPDDQTIPDPGPPFDASASAHCSELGRAIRRLRHARRLTIEDLACAAGMHAIYLSAIERGVCNPSWDKLCPLADALDLSMATLAKNAEDEAVLARAASRASARERHTGADAVHMSKPTR
ncbi:MAG TPA: helix-turn-helix transcriptional regulator [Solirubrobacteraceae bacterium]|nr:helix-turn-helix transcriptional regulator [Solirubrobacteraceae bacterium]